MKKVSVTELVMLSGGSVMTSSCAQVQYIANMHMIPENPSTEEQDAEERFWKHWCTLYDLYCS